MKEIKTLAEQEKMTVSAWVRRAIMHEKKDRPGINAKTKLEVIRKSSEYTFPTGNIEDMIADIERSYLKGLNG